jgi:DNA primase
MAGFVGEDQVRLIKSRIDLVQLMGEYTPLRKSGANFSGCCAFHQERTPSMYVYPDQQTYHCFGCGAHGDAISLLREKERVDFSDALELLAKRAGVTITYQNQGKGQFAQHAKGERDELMAAVEFAVSYYERVLWEAPDGAPGREYLASRGMSQAVCKRFRLGWAPGSGMLVDEARRKGVAMSALIKTDLAVDRSGRIADRFWERVMFPICDRFGGPIAFSGRLLPAAERKAKEEGRGVGKYINNTDTPLYHKGHAVFNLHRARLASRDKNRLIVMEGPTDVMAADDAGFSECVAVLGTALTSEHARQLGNLVGNQGRLVILLDGDRAGQANSIKAVRTCLAVGVPVRVAVLPDELDPAELLSEHADREQGRARLEAVLAGGRTDIDHLLRALAPRPYDLDSRARLTVTDQVLEAIRAMPDIELRALHLRDVADYFGIERTRLERRLLAVAAKAPPAQAGEAAAQDAAGSSAAQTDLLPLTPAQDLALHVLTRCPELRTHASDGLALEPSHFPEIWRDLASHLLLIDQADIHTLASLEVVQAHPRLHEAAFRWASSDLISRVPAVSDPRGDLGDAVLELKKTRLKDLLHRLGRDIADCEKAGDIASLSRLNAERLSLTRELKDLIGQSGFSAGT